MNDLISRQAAIDALDVGAELLRRVLDAVDIVGVERAKYEWGLGLVESYIADMKELPSAQPYDYSDGYADGYKQGQKDAQPERKTGKWNTYVHDNNDFTYSCNMCGYSAPYQMTGGEVFQKKWNFCPNCGAKMEGR